MRKKSRLTVGLVAVLVTGSLLFVLWNKSSLPSTVDEDSSFIRIMRQFIRRTMDSVLTVDADFENWHDGQILRRVVREIPLSDNQLQSGGSDIDPLLWGGIQGSPGVKVRLNPTVFQYASEITRYLLDKEVTGVRLAEITHEINQVHTYVRIYDIGISGYRSPEIVAVTPGPPNQVTITLRNFDFALSGTLQGTVGLLLLPMPINGYAHATFNQVSITIQLSVNVLASGQLNLGLVQCLVEDVGNVHVSTSGPFADMANLPLFNNMVTNEVRSSMPGELCKMAPSVVNGKLNRLLQDLPPAIPFSKIGAFTRDILGGVKLPPQATTNWLHLGLEPRTAPDAANFSSPQRLFVHYIVIYPCDVGSIKLPPQCYEEVCRRKPLPPEPSPHLPSVPPRTSISHGQIVPHAQFLPRISPQLSTNNIHHQRFNHNSPGQTPREIRTSNVEIPMGFNTNPPRQQQGQRWGVSPNRVPVHRNRQSHRRPQIGNSLARRVIPEQQGMQVSHAGHARLAAFGSPNTGPISPRNYTQIEPSTTKNDPPTQNQPPETPESIIPESSAPSPSPSNHSQDSKDSAHPTKGSKPSQLDYELLYHQLMTPFANSIHKFLSLLQRRNPAAQKSLKDHSGVNTRGVKTSNRIDVLDPASASTIEQCALCPPDAGEDLFGTITGLMKQSFDTSMLADVALSMRVMQVESTSNDQIILINGEFSPGGNGGTPFGPFPLQFPAPSGVRMSMLADVALSMRVMQVESTSNDQIILINGEFSPGGNGGTPFGPFPLQFPAPSGVRMVEAVVSDFTINSLLYNIHKSAFEAL